MARRLPAALVTAFLLGTAATMPALPQSAPYEINVILSLTGPDAFIGSEESAALTIAQDVVNKAGGIKGRPIRFVVEDDASIPQNSVQLMGGLIAKKVPLVLGSTVVALCNAMQPLIAQAGPVDYCFSPIIEPANGSYAFAVAMTTRDIVSAMADFARARGWKRLGMITSTDATGLAMEKQFDAVLPGTDPAAPQFVDREHFADTDISVAAQVARVKDQHPQAILAFSAGTSFGTLLHNLSDAGIDVPVIASAANMARGQLSQYSAFLPHDLYFFSAGGVAPDPSAPAAVRNAQRVYFDAFRAAGKRPGIFSADAWDPIMIAVDALRALGTGASAQQIRDYIEHLQGWAGVSGLYDFRKYVHRGLGESATVTYRWDAARNDIAVVPQAK
jgi:branched-chain amino acid transport system substrate-binding protein